MSLRGSSAHRAHHRAEAQEVTLLPACLEDYVEAGIPVRVVEVFVDGLDLGELGFEGVDPAPAYHPAVLLMPHRFAAAAHFAVVQASAAHPWRCSPREWKPVALG